MTQPAVAARPRTIDELIASVQREFPTAAIRITGRARTIRRQAELMAERIRANRAEFLATYARRPHIVDMDTWYAAHTNASLAETVTEFERIIRVAISGGATVSNHLSDSARDISWPRGSAVDLDRIQARMEVLGARVIREPNAAGGRHWHVDW